MKQQSFTTGSTTTTRAVVRRVVPWATAAVVLTALPFTGGGAQADDGATPGPTDFSGFATSGYAAPVRLEIYEPTIPIPADPQAEVNFAYTAVKADSGSSRGRSSYTWPGDAVGEGTKTILENLGIPLPDAVTSGGYPVQVNSTYPGGPESDYNEPVPGVLQRTASGAKVTYAQTGAAADGDPENGSDADPEAAQPTGGSTAAADPLSTVSGLLGNGPSGLVSQITNPSPSPTTGSTGSSTGAAPLLPAGTAPVIDVGSFASVTRSTAGNDRVRMHARSKASDISILSGILQIGSVAVDVQTISNGKKATTTSKATYGDMSIAGQPFTIGPDGVQASGQPSSGALPSDPAAMLKQLGISITVPEPNTQVKDLLAKASRQGLRVEIDTKQLRSQLDSLPLGDLTSMLPDDLGPLKSVLQAGVGARPRMVLLLGTANASTETVKPLDLDLGTTTPETEAPAAAAATEAPAAAAPAAEAPAAGGAPAAAAGGSAGGLASAPTSGLAAGATPTTTDVSTTPTAASAGLPPLASIPGALLFGGIAIGALVGSYLRRLGLLALGGGGSCPHGLDSGLPDLRKA